MMSQQRSAAHQPTAQHHTYWSSLDHFCTSV